jgi:hypothetical protein
MMGTRSAILAELASLFTPDGAGNILLDQSPPQFDSSLKLMTTAAASQAGIQSSGITLATTTETLTFAVVGGTVLGNSSTANTQTLPAASSIPSGKRIEFLNINIGTMTVARNGTTDTITVNNTVVTSLSLGSGDTLTLESNGLNGWYAVGGSVQLGYAGMFSSSLVTAGYQKLPSGFIIQWGGLGTGGGNTAGTFPITFPVGCLQFLPGLYATLSPSNYTVGGYAVSNSSYVVNAAIGQTGANAAGVNVRWLAIGQ